MSGLENSQSSIPQNIQHYYDRGLEIHRLSGAVGELELFRTKEIIGRYLPQPPALILDVGGGPGIYACWLAKEGYEIHLIDPIPLHAEQARQASQNQPGFSITTSFSKSTWLFDYLGKYWRCSQSCSSGPHS